MNEHVKAPGKNQAKPRRVEITGHSQITVNKKWVAAIVLILLVFTGLVGWMYMVAATSRPPIIKTGGVLRQLAGHRLLFHHVYSRRLSEQLVVNGEGTI